MYPRYVPRVRPFSALSLDKNWQSRLPDDRGRKLGWAPSANKPASAWPYWADATSNSFRDLEHGVANVTVMVEQMTARICEFGCRVAELDAFESYTFDTKH